VIDHAGPVSDHANPVIDHYARTLRTDSPEKVLVKLATSNKATIVVERHPDGKMRVTSKFIFARSGA
jgi:hypothetical protein